MHSDQPANRSNGRAPATQLLMHPVALVALAVLVLNDWVLKPNASVRGFANGLGAVATGKLSDAAGLVLAPLVVLAMMQLGTKRPVTRQRCWLAIALVVVPFCACKLSPAVALQAGELFSLLGRRAYVVADPWDLLMLPAVGIIFIAAVITEHRPQYR